MIWLGVDGGGSKTALALVDADGAVLAETVTGGTYYLTEGLPAVTERLRTAIAAVCNDAGVVPADLTGAFFGLPGYGEVRADTATLDALPAGILGHNRYRCGNDMVCAWAGSLAGADGVNVIAGTGSMTYGERAGRGARVGGWGEVFGDEGSAHWIGVEGLRAASRMSDGRAPHGPLLDVLREHLRLEADTDLIDVVLGRWRGDRGKIAALARLVDLAARGGDPAAAAILAAAADELALLVTTTRAALEWPGDEAVPVSWSGGVFGSDVVRVRFEAALATAGGAYAPREPVMSPVLGAALLARRGSS